MSTRKSRMIEGCADCGAPDASWASINRGVLICEECCSVHRSLGRHISQIRSLKRGHWSATLSAMVQQLANSSANNIWEHTLLDPTQNKHGRRKPGPKDPVHPNKADFIRKKYQFLAFTNKHNDGDEDLSRQLHSCVRTNNLETCLRLLSKGADPNFFHHEKRNCPIHVAAQAGQMSQVELLVVYGADPGILDSSGKTPTDYALSESHMELVDRLDECQYELTDRLAYFLCLRTPDHRTGAHFIIPEIGDSNLDLSELAKQAKKKLQNLPDALFEELAKDIYDEVDRRENNGIWNNRIEHLGSMNNISSDRQTIPFLPVNPEFSTTRNQGRQKLAHLNAREFATLIIDILIDAKRRHMGMAVPIMSPKDPEPLDMEWNSYDVDDGIEESDPIYDYVPEDDEISTAETQSVQSLRIESHTTATSNGIISEADLDDHISVQTLTEPSVSSEDLKQMHQKLLESQSQIQQLKSAKKGLQYEVKMLQNMMCQVQEENRCLKDELSNQSGSPRNPQLSAAHSQPVLTTTVHPQALRQHTSVQQHANDAALPSQCQGDKENNISHPPITSTPRSGQLPVAEPLQNGGLDDDAIQIRRLSRGGQRPKSMIEPWDQQKLENDFGTLSSTSAVSEVNLTSILRDVGNISSLSDINDTMEHSDTSPHSDSELPSSRTDNHEITSNQINAATTTEGTMSLTGSMGAEAKVFVMPSQEDLKARTEQISKTIRQLMFLAQQSKHDSFQACAEEITEAVDEIVSIFPKSTQSEGNPSPPTGIYCALALLQSSSRQLQADCQACRMASSTSTELQIRTKHVIQHAYDITKAARELVAMLQSKVFKNS